MSIQSITPSLMNLSQLLSQFSGTLPNAPSNDPAGTTNPNADGSAASGLSIASTSYQANSLNVLFQSADGDSVTLSSQSVEIQKAMLAGNKDNSPDDWKKIVDYLKQQYASLKDEIVKSVFGNKDQTNTAAAQPATQSPSNNGIAGLPDYWNADNTSQRIVDFATSFLSAFKGSGEEFLSMIKDAIDKGFSEASDITGKLPDAVSGLVKNTHDLVMQKLDAWAKQQGISVPDDSTGGATTSADATTADQTAAAAVQPAA